MYDVNGAKSFTTSYAVAPIPGQETFMVKYLLVLTVGLFWILTQNKSPLWVIITLFYLLDWHESALFVFMYSSFLNILPPFYIWHYLSAANILCMKDSLVCLVWFVGNALQQWRNTAVHAQFPILEDVSLDFTDFVLWLY